MSYQLTDSDCAEIMRDLILQNFPQLKGRMRVFYKKQHEALYSVRERKAQALLIVGLPLNHPRLALILRRAGCSCLEVIQHRTSAVCVMEHEGVGCNNEENVSHG